MMGNADIACRLDRLLTLLGLAARSEAREIIKAGRVRVNQAAARSAEQRIVPGDQILLDGQIVDARTRRHIMLNKPCGVLTAARDPRQPTVMDLLPPVYRAIGCMPVGRLDKDTEGLLLLTTDGTLCHRLLSPKQEIWKCYWAAVDGPLSEDDRNAFAAGLTLSDFTALPARLEILRSGEDASEAKVWVCEGKYHQVRRMFATRGRTVTALKRLSVGPLRLDAALQPGEYRELTETEYHQLQDAAGGKAHAEE